MEKRCEIENGHEIYFNARAMEKRRENESFKYKIVEHVEL
jgi:hypothetical protein